MALLLAPLAPPTDTLLTSSYCTLLLYSANKFEVIEATFYKYF